MAKKLLICIISFGWLFAPYTHAWMSSPYLNITVNENTVGGDNSFNFHISGGNPGIYFGKDFNIQTTAGFGTNFTGATTGGGDTYIISQDPVAGWKSIATVCTSDNPPISISYGSNMAIITAYPYSSITCNFTNSKEISKTPVLFIPGVLGTDIFKGTDLLWVDLGNMALDIGDEFMDPLQFQTDLEPLDSSLKIGEVVGKPSILFDYSDGLVKEFQNQGYTQGSSSSDTLFLFPYDWRYGISGKYANGSTTVDFLQAKIQEIRGQTHSDKVDVIAHSTGGLLVKKYVMGHPEDNHIGKVVFVGVPNTGAPKAIKTLLAGDSFGVPWLADSEMQKIAQNLPVVYDLSPSQKYFNVKGSYVKIIDQGLFGIPSHDLDFNQVTSFLIDDHKANAQAISNAQNLHTSNFDNYDMRTAGIDLYSIDGCKAGTISKVVERRIKDIFGGITISYDNPEESPGDGTVPLESSTNLPIYQSNKFYSLNADHGKMPSQDGIRQQIVNIISGSHLSTQSSVGHGDLITQDISKCKLNGKAISVYSPLSIDIVDQDGNHSGLLSDGVSIQNDIPNADFEIMGEHKFVYLPNDDGQTYNINVKGTDKGIFTIKDQDINDNKIQQTQIFSNLPVTTSLTGTVNLGSGGGQTTLTLKASPTSTPVVVAPSSVIDALQSQDLTPPISTSTISGTMGESGFYRSGVKVNFSALDPIVDSNSSTTSGLLKTQYSLDGGAWQTLTPPPSLPPQGGGMGTVAVTSEGSHTVNFFSTDRAGNNEQPQIISFTIDKTAPEAVIQFNPTLKDIQFTGSDNVSTSSKVTVVDNVNDITLTDQAGNVMDIKLKEKDRKKSMQSTIQSLSYNGTQQDVSKNTLAFLWTYDKSGNLTKLSQNVAAKKSYYVLAVYNGKKTTLAGIDKTGIILKSINGLSLLKVTTSKGDLGWGY